MPDVILELLVPYWCVIYLTCPAKKIHFGILDSVCIPTFWPCGFVRYQNLESLARGTKWYPFKVSIVILHVFPGTFWIFVIGDWFRCVWTEVALLSGLKFAVPLQDPSFFLTTFILEHQHTRVLTGTRSIIFKARSINGSLCFLQ